MQRRERTGAAPTIHPPSVVAEGASLGRDVVVGAFCFVARGASVGAGTRIQSHTSVWAGVELGEDGMPKIPGMPGLGGDMDPNNCSIM